MNKLRISIFLIIALTFTSLKVDAKTYEIKGTAPNSAFSQLTIFSFEELFTGKLKVEKTVTIGADETFSETIEASENSAVVLRIESINAQIYLGGSDVYEVVFDISKVRTPVRFTNTNWTSVEFINLKETDINAQLESLNRVHSEFYEDQAEVLYQVFTSPSSAVKDKISSKKKKVDMIKGDGSTEEVKKEKDQALNISNLFASKLAEAGFSTSGNNYVSISAKYMTAELESLLGRNLEELYEDYLQNDFHLRNEEFMSFYKSYYRNVLGELHETEVYADMIKELYKLNLDSTFIEANKVLNIEKPEALSLAMLSGIESGFDLPNISSRDVTLILELLTREVKGAVGLMAANYRAQLAKGKSGYTPNDFMLLDLDEKRHNLSDFQGQFVYLSFFSTWNTESVGHQQKIKQLESKYGNRITFVSVCMDYDWEEFRNFLADNRSYNWTFLFGNTEKLLKENLSVTTVPHYILLDPNGSFLLSHTPSPEEGIQPVFEKILRN